MSFANIPNELKQLTQWVCWKYAATDTGKPTKLPYNPHTHRMASVTDPSTWTTFDAAVAAVGFGYDGIGFVFTANDPYCGLDLDGADDEETRQRQYKVAQAMNSYTELSPSKNGAHIIVRARVPHGRKRAAIEIYSNERFFTFTGDVVSNNTAIEDRQALVSQLWEELGQGATATYFAGDPERRMWNEEVYNKAAQAYNGDLFVALWNGDWKDRYPSQSEADQALMNILAFYTKNRMQLVELFRQSGLGQRDKAKRDKYLDYTIDRAFDMTLPPLDMGAVIDQVNAAVAQAREQQKVVTSSPYHEQPQQQQSRQYEGFDLDMWRNVRPPRTLALIKDYIYRQSPRPVHEIALAGALGLMAGITGRAYNVSGTGLNQYIMMLAPTGRGKEAIPMGVNKIMSAVAGNDFPAAWDFLGPADMASGSGLLKHLAERVTPCFVAVTGEIGLRLQQMSYKNANTADVTLRRVLLDLYGKSGMGQTLRPTVYSDKKNNVEMIHSPAFTWLGESTPHEFYKGLSEDQIASGLMPRFLIIEYNGDRVPFNERHEHAFPQSDLVDCVRDLCNACLMLAQDKKCIAIQFADEAARSTADLINQFCDFKMNSMPDGPLAQLWNRAHLKVLKISALLALAHNHHQPLIDRDMVLWANSLVLTDVLTIIGRFERGEVGGAEVKMQDSEQVAHIRRFVRQYLMGEVPFLSSSQLAHKDKGLILYGTLTQGCAPYKAFKQDVRGASRALAAAIEEVVKHGAIAKLSKADAAQQYGLYRGEVYQITDPQWFFNTN